MLDGGPRAVRERDELRCGGDADTAVFDPGDLLDACEDVDGFAPIALSAGVSRSCLVRSGGTAECWGAGMALGTSLVPFGFTSGTANTTVAIVESPAHQCRVVSGGGVQCSGRNGDGQLGWGGIAPRTGWQTVAGLQDAVAVATGGDHSCALRAGGTVVCWGRNASGQVGDGTTTRRPAPVAVTGLNDVTAIATGGAHTCALRATGEVFCWGDPGDGRLGFDTSRTAWTTPGKVRELRGAVAITAGLAHTCATLDDARVVCWGDNDAGQLGDGTTDDRTTPVTAVGAVTASAGAHHTCGFGAGRVPLCWGSNADGQLGDGTKTDRLAPTPVLVVRT